MGLLGRVAALASAAATALVLGAAFAPSVGAASGGSINSDWPTYGRTFDEQRFSPLTQVAKANAARLGVAWWAQFDTDRGQEGTPLIVDGRLFTTTAWSKAYAFDARTGRQLWSYDPKVPGRAGLSACCDVINRGAAYWQGRLFFGTLDGRLIALDATTGQLLWSVQTTDPDQAYTITGAPRVVKGKVLIGNGGAEYGVRGYISAYDAANGALSWRFYTTPNAKGLPDHAASDAVLKAKAGPTWFDGAWRQTGAGGTVWDAITYDPKTDLLFVGVGNGSPWNHKIRSGGRGDNLFLASIVALKPEDGRYVWHYQTTPGESWDYTATQGITVADLMIAGRPRHVIMQAPKNGFFYVLDAATGALISADKYVPIVDWADHIDLRTGRPVENPAARYPNGTTSRIMVDSSGAHNWHPMAFNPTLGLVYIPTMRMRGTFVDPDHFDFTPGVWNLGEGWPVDSPSHRRIETARDEPPVGELVAWDPVAKRARWRVRLDPFWGGGVLATASGLVFQANGDSLVAYDAATGERVAAYPLGAPAIAPPVTYEIDGVQYVALMVGSGGDLGISLPVPRRPGRLLVFALDAHADVTPFASPPQPMALDLGKAQASAGDADAGARSFSRYCSACHRGGVFLPDLTRSSMILTPQSLKSVVYDGALESAGMVSFKRYLSPKDVEDLRAYLLWRAGPSSRGPRLPAGTPAAADQ